MFSSALKSLTSNISSNYTISPNPSTTAGPWKIFDAKKKTTGKAASVFVFDRRSLEPGGGGGGSISSSRGGGGASLKRAHDEVVERLKKEASSLARLRHPSILELQEPVEETRTGGLIFVTEPVTASLAGLLEEKDEQERNGGPSGRGSKYVVEDPDGGGKKRREIEVDELEIQKGLLQIGKGLEFLHESAGLVHANLSPDAIFVNAKSDWKISGLGFASPQENAVSATASSMTPIQLSEVLNYDSRLPKSVQLNLDYTSPDFVIDNNINPGADMFSLGLVIIALYNSPHRSPLDTGFSLTQFKRIFSNQSTIPTKNNNFLTTQQLPKDISTNLLPRLITRRPAQRLGARDLQQAQYFDNILVSTIRFLDSLPAKTANEKSQFMRGLPRILPQFPKTVLEKKVLPALLDEMKDHDLLSLILQNVFKVIALASNSKRVFSEKVVPRLREVFLVTVGHGKNKELERDTSKEAGLVILLENMPTVTTNCTGKEFKDDILPIIFYGLDSPTHSVVDKALQTLSIILPVLDFSTIKNDLFPIVAVVFSKTSSMAIKIRGLEALKVLCGGAQEAASDMSDGLGELTSKAKSNATSSAVLDKYTVQEKVVPLLKAIKTKEPAVMMSALEVFKQVSKIADSEYLALEALPCLWQFSLGPLLNVDQFKAFMLLIKSMSTKIEQERIRKLQELSSSSRYSSSGTNGFGASGTGEDGDFESLVTGRKAGNPMEDDSWGDAWDTEATPKNPNSRGRFGQSTTQQPTFAWSNSNNNKPIKTNPKPSLQTSTGLAPPSAISRTVTPDQSMSSYASLTPANRSTGAPASSSMNSFSQPLQPQTSNNNANSNFDWSSLNNANNPWASNSLDAAFGSSTSGLNNSMSNFSIAPPPSNQMNGKSSQQQSSGQSGLDKYGSLL